MSETENTSANYLRRKTTWALTLSIISLLLNIILITALWSRCNQHTKWAKHPYPGRGFAGPGPAMVCPPMGPCCNPAGMRPPGPPPFNCPQQFGCGEMMGPGRDWHQGGPRNFGMHGHMGKRMLEFLTDKLNLDDNQQAKVKQIMQDERVQFAKLDMPDPEGVKKIMEDGHAKIRAVLKPDQQKKYDELIARFAERMKQREEAR